MPPIPIHSDKPINPTAAKASPLHPQTAGDNSNQNFLPPPATTSASTSDDSSTTRVAPSPRQPAMPAPTGAVNANVPNPRPPPPTATYPMPESFGPPPPQPGPVPVPFIPRHESAATSQIPSSQSTQSISVPQPPTTTTPARLPPQFSVPAPTDSLNYRPTHSTHPSTAPSSSGDMLSPTSIAPGLTNAPFIASPQTALAPHNNAPEPGPSLDHPPGYVQNPYADTMTATQRAEQRAQESADAQGADVKRLSGVLGGGDGTSAGITGNEAWDAAKKWVGGVAVKAAEMEQEVWKKINGQ